MNPLERLKKWVAGSAETLLVLTCVVGFFLVLLGTLTISFPQGTGLRNLYGDLVLPSDNSRSLLLGGGTEDGGVVARLRSVTRNVRDRPVDALAWSTAKSGASLGDRHAVQTLDRSTAVVTILDRGELQLGENSLVVIRRSARRKDYRSHRTALVLLGGSIRGTVGTAASGDLPLDIVTAGAQTAIVPGDDASTEFDIVANADESSTLRVFSGSAEVKLGDETAVIEPNQALTIAPDQPLGRPTEIMDAPHLTAPRDGVTRYFGSVTASVDFSWSPQGAADAYRLTIARDRELAEIVHEADLKAAEFRHENLPDGEYFWRVTSVSGGVAGRESPARALRLVRDAEPPTLDVALPANVAEDRLTIRGTTEPGARVLIGDDVVPTDDGGVFEYALDLRRGPNVVVIEAVDEAGNVAYRSEYVHAKF